MLEMFWFFSFTVVVVGKCLFSLKSKFICSYFFPQEVIPLSYSPAICPLQYVRYAKGTITSFSDSQDNQ